MRSVRTRRTLVLLAAAGVLAAGCSSTTGGPEPSGSSAATMTVPSADGPGVTEDTIYIGSPFGGDDAPPTGTVDEEASAMIAAMDLPWPGDRTVKVVSIKAGKGDESDDEYAQIVCDQVESMEQKVMAVIYDWEPGPMVDCLAEQDVLLLANNVQLPPEELAPNSLTLSTSMPIEPVPGAIVGDLADRGWFGDDATTAVLMGGNPDKAELLEQDTENLTAALEEVGSKGNETITLDASNADELSSALLRLKSGGVDHVLCWLCGDAFAVAAKAQDYDPAFAAWDGPGVGAPFYDYKPAGWGENAVRTFVGYSSHPNYTLPQITDTLQQDERVAKCRSAMPGGGQITLDSGGATTYTCMNPALISAGLAAAPEGAGVNAQAVIAGLQSLTGEQAFSWPAYGAFAFGPDQASGGNELFVSTLDPGCTCLLTEDDPISLDG